MYAFNRDIDGETPVARLSPTTNLWERIPIPPGFAVWGGVIDVCGGVLAFGKTEILFNGRPIYTLSAPYSSMVATYADGKMLIDLMGPKGQTFVYGRWACGEASMSEVARFDDPTNGHLSAGRNFPYMILKARPDAGGFVVGTNIGDVYLIDEKGLTIVNNWAWPPHNTSYRALRGLEPSNLWVTARTPRCTRHRSLTQNFADRDP